MKKFILLIVLTSLGFVVKAQVCAIPGNDGPVTLSGSATVNTYYPPAGDMVIVPGSSSINLGAVPPPDLSSTIPNSFGTSPIVVGDLLLIIQMQDASIHVANSNRYGSDMAKPSPDGFGGTGYTSLGNTGLYEYVVATNSVPLTGGNLSFKGAGAGNGTVNTFINNSAATAISGKKTFQIIRVPQYSSLKLSSSISVPRFNGVVGGIIVFDVAGTFDFNGYTIDASASGFRGGIGLPGNSQENTSELYMTNSGQTEGNGKGEGIVGTPRYTWDGFFEFGVNIATPLPEGIPGGPSGKGAPGNAGGGGNDHNAGGGGGGNGGYGGVGGNGAHDVAGTLVKAGVNPFPNGGRPGSVTYNTLPEIKRLVMGGGGGGGDSNQAINNSKGGVGGAIVIINAGRISGTGLIKSNGGDGIVGLIGSDPDGAGGGGAGGTVYLKVADPDPTANITVEVKGGKGGNTENDSAPQVEHGPGGGGGGGLVFSNILAATLNANVAGGIAGVTKQNTNHGAMPGTNGVAMSYSSSTGLPSHLQGGSSACLPELETTLNVENPAVPKFPGSEITYTITVTNTGGSSAAGVLVETLLDNGISFQSATVANSASGNTPTTVLNTGLTKLAFGDFIIAAGHTLTVVIKAQVNCTNATPATYHASAQALYLDPTRSGISTAKITSAVAAFTGSNTTYESGVTVPGFNFNGAGSGTDDVLVITALPITNNTITTADFELCLVPSVGAAPGTISGSLPTGDVGNFIYQWESSTDGVNFVTIPGANLQDFTPPAITVTTYYRRLVRNACTSPIVSDNIITVTVRESSNANFELPVHCVGDGTATFTNTSVSDITTMLTYEWDFGDPASGPLNTSTAEDGQHLYNIAGVYTVTLKTISPSGCESTIMKTFTVSGPPVADFEVRDKDVLCSGNEVEFFNMSSITIGEITKIEWYFDNDANSTIPDIVENSPATRTDPYTHAYPALPTTKIYNVRMVVYSGISCTHVKIISVTVNALPEVVFSPMPAVCVDNLAFPITQVSVTPGITGTGTFTGMGVSASGLFDPFLAGIGTHRIFYSFKSDAANCTTTAFEDITVSESPSAESDSLDIMLGASATLPTIAANSGLTYQWTPSAFLSSSNTLNPVASPVETTIYELTVTDILTGCTATGNVKVIVNKIPEIRNTFTPNGDGINDYWRIINLETYNDCTVKIYNRYGEQVFDSRGYKIPWDGTYQGKDLPTATYYYVIDPKKGRKPMSGSITILR